MNEDGFFCDGEGMLELDLTQKFTTLCFQMWMNVYLIHVTPMQHVITPLVVLAVLVSVVILEMAFSVMVSYFDVFVKCYYII